MQAGTSELDICLSQDISLNDTDPITLCKRDEPECYMGLCDRQTFSVAERNQ